MPERDRSILTLLLLLLSLLGNIALASQMFVGRGEYNATLRSVDTRLAGIEKRLGIYSPHRRALAPAEDDD